MISTVFLPGFSIRARIWKNSFFFNQDLPGQAHDAAPENLEEVLKRIVKIWVEKEFEKIDLIGWSLGGMLAQELALRYPQKIRKLVLIASTPQFLSSETWSFGVRPAALKLLQKNIEKNLAAGLESFLQTAAAGPEKNILYQIQKDLENTPETAAFYLKFLAGFSNLENLNQIRQPVLILAGLKDGLCPYPAQNQLFERIPNSKLIGITEAGHFPFLTHRELVEKQIGLFLD